jgi:uncharacterized cupredoxin-like copper-binding protein
MSNLSRQGIYFATGLAFALSMTAASAATVVKVELWDKGADATMVKGLAYGKPSSDMSMARMGIKLSRLNAQAGVVIFQVTNESKDLVHEMIVMYRQDSAKLLPYIDTENRVDEEKAGDKGEVSELDPGKSGSLTVVLKPGKYVLICNMPGHFDSGMWTEFEVTE